MKCPECGQWNRAHMPRCQKCGAILPESGEEIPSWKDKVRDKDHGSQYLRMDENGETDAAPDRRDTLAEEMADLKQRKAEGALRMQKLRRDSAARGVAPSAMEVRVHTGAAGAWQEEDMPIPQARTRRSARESVLTRPVVRSDNGIGGWEEDNVRASYDPMWAEQTRSSRGQQPGLGTPPRKKGFTMTYVPSRARSLHRVVRVLLILLIVLLVALCGYFGYHYFQSRSEEQKTQNQATVFASIKDDLAAHTILIPGEDGQQIYIRELHATYDVVDGFATVQVADHTWYDDVSTYLDETMLVTLTPYLKSSSGQQKALDVINYEIEIPLSPLTMNTPDSLRTEVASSMYTMKFTVRPGSTVTINGKDVSDTVDSEDGTLSYNAGIQAIGDNEFTVVCKSQYCRENTINLVIYREPQEIPLDLAADTYTSTSSQTMLVSATTLAGATIDVLSDYTDLNVTNLNTTGEFSFYAVFNEIGYNTIEITSAYPGKKTSHITYQVYYIPDADHYTTKAWSMDADGYSELVGNITYRAEHHQVYVIMGYIDHFVSEKPQMAVIYTSSDGKNQPVLVQNYTSTTWTEGTYYRMYADVYGSYDNMPWLYTRYTYTY